MEIEVNVSTAIRMVLKDLNVMHVQGKESKKFGDALEILEQCAEALEAMEAEKQKGGSKDADHNEPRKDV